MWLHFNLTTVQSLSPGLSILCLHLTLWLHHCLGHLSVGLQFTWSGGGKLRNVGFKPRAFFLLGNSSELKVTVPPRIVIFNSKWFSCFCQSCTTMPASGHQNSCSQRKHGNNVLKHMALLKNMTKCWKQRALEERLSHLTWVGDIFSSF